MAYSISLALALFFICCLHGAAGYKSLFIGHSFFRPVADKMPQVTAAAGLSHDQATVFSGGETGAPEALWNNVVKRLEIQGHLDAGDIELFGMTYEGTYPTIAGYELWFDYALAKNPNTKFMLALPWLDYPSFYNADEYASAVRIDAIAVWEDLLVELRGKYPDATIINVPYGLGVAELRLLFDAGILPGVFALTGPGGVSLHTDNKGHGGEIVFDLSSLIWLNRIYDVDLSTYGGPLEYMADLTVIAASVLDAYDAGDLCGSYPCSCVDNDARIAQLAASIGETWVSGCTDVLDYCEANSQEGRQVRQHCCQTCLFY